MPLNLDENWMHGGLTPDGDVPDASMLDLSVNINPYGPHPELSQFLRLQAFDQYPDPRQKDLRHAIALGRGTDADSILIGNGCNELFWAAARAFLSQKTPWISVEPNYSEFARAASATGATKIECRAQAVDDFRWSAGTLDALIRQHKPRLVMLSNPCSPTGFMQDTGIVRDLAAAHPTVLFCIDQSFLSLSRHWLSDFDQGWSPNVLRFHSLTKDFAIAGLRLGYVEAHPDHRQAMEQQIPTWSVNSLAQAAGLWIARHPETLTDSRKLLLADHDALEAGLKARGLRYIPSQTIFTLWQPAHAEDLRQRLWQKHGILLRSCASYDLPDWLRVAARPLTSLHHFWKALDEELPCPH